jgi:bacillithiol system protein YtxJ
MKWKSLEKEEQLQQIIEQSYHKVQLIFKHSTSCNISADAFEELKHLDYDGWYLDLLSNRAISNKIAEVFEIKHQSPQVILLKNGQAFYNESHWRINSATISTLLK